MASSPGLFKNAKTQYSLALAQLKDAKQHGLVNSLWEKVEECVSQYNKAFEEMERGLVSNGACPRVEHCPFLRGSSARSLCQPPPPTHRCHATYQECCRRTCVGSVVLSGRGGGNACGPPGQGA